MNKKKIFPKEKNINDDDDDTVRIYNSTIMVNK